MRATLAALSRSMRMNSPNSSGVPAGAVMPTQEWKALIQARASLPSWMAKAVSEAGLGWKKTTPPCWQMVGYPGTNPALTPSWRLVPICKT